MSKHNPKMWLFYVYQLFNVKVYNHRGRRLYFSYVCVCNLVHIACNNRGFCERSNAQIIFSAVIVVEIPLRKEFMKMNRVYLLYNRIFSLGQILWSFNLTILWVKCSNPNYTRYPSMHAVANSFLTVLRSKATPYVVLN